MKRHHFCQNIPWLMTGQIVLAPRCSYLIRDYPVTQHFKLYFLFLAHREHRITEQLGLERTSGDHLTPLLKQGLLEWIAQDHVQSGFEYLQRWRHEHGKIIFVSAMTSTAVHLLILLLLLSSLSPSSFQTNLLEKE